MIGMHFTSPSPADPVGDVTHVRLWDAGVTWKDIHTAPDSYNWARLDTLMDTYKEAHHLCHRRNPTVGRQRPDATALCPLAGRWF